MEAWWHFSRMTCHPSIDKSRNWCRPIGCAYGVSRWIYIIRRNLTQVIYRDIRFIFKSYLCNNNMSLRMTKPTKWHVCPEKTQISLGIHSLLCAQLVYKDPSFLHVDSKDSDQTGHMPRLI